MTAHQMQNDDTENITAHGQELIALIAEQLVKQACACPLIYASEAEPLDKYPYITYSIITPEEDTTADWLGDARQYNCLFQFDAHSDNPFEANELAQKLHEALRSKKYLNFFEQCNIVPTSVTNTQNRTVLANVNYDNCFGFDCSFLVTGNGSYDISKLSFKPTQELTIDTAHAEGHGQSIDTKKNFKEE